MLNIIWIGFFLIAFLTGMVRFLFFGEAEVFGEMMLAMFSLSKTAFEIALGLTGVLALWLGIMRIGERSGTQIFAIQGHCQQKSECRA